VYKLRFRAAGGGVRVIYLGSDAERARRVEEALGRWQEARRAELDLARLGREIARELRDSKRRLAPFLTEHGLHFHGRAIRTKALPNVARNHKHEQG
jgi:hypothetical protein